VEDRWDICNYDNSSLKNFRSSIKKHYEKIDDLFEEFDLPDLGVASSTEIVVRETKPSWKDNFNPRRVVENIKNLIAQIKPEHVVAIGVAVAVCVGAFIAIKHLIAPKPVEAEEESNAPKPTLTGYKQPTIVPQSDALSVMHDKVYNNSYKMIVDMGEGETTALGQVIFVSNTVALMPNHFIIQLQSAIEARTASNSSRVYLLPGHDTGAKIITSIGAFLSYPRKQDNANDVAFVNFSGGVRLHSDITNCFMEESQIAKMGGYGVTIHVAESFKDQGRDTCRRMAIVSEAKVGRAPLQTSTRSYPKWLCYSAVTLKGYCGAPVMLTQNNFFKNRFIAGIHVAGAPAHRMGYATWVSEEMVKRAMAHFKVRHVPEATHVESLWPADIHVQSIDEVNFTGDGTLGTAKPLYEISDGPSAPIKSKLVLTGFGKDKAFDNEIMVMNEGREPPELVPMKLGKHVNEDNEIIYPMMEAVKPFVGDVFVPALNSFSKGLAAGLKPFATATRNYNARTLSFDEAVIGVPSMSLKSITRSTSVGFPLCMVAADKKYFFGSDEDFNLTTKEALLLQEEVGVLDGLVRSGRRPQFVCRDFLKDETRKKGKGARLIAGTDIRYYILCRKYFGAFVGAICRSHQESGMCLGMNPYSEWDVLKRILLNPDPTGKNVWDGDFAQFDSSQMPRLLWDCLEYINNWYSVRGHSEDNGVREILFHDLVSSRHLMSLTGKATTIVEWSKSLPSGHFLTSSINSMLSMGLVASSYIGLTGNIDFWETSAVVSLGDDNVVSTSEKFVDVFNQVTVSKYLKDTFDMTYTAGRKGEELRPTIGIDNVVFLQRRFAEKNGRVVCPIRPESFLHSLYYVKSTDNARNLQTLRDGIELAFEELSMHDEKFWSLVAPKLVEAKAKLGDVPNQNVVNSDAYFDLVQGRVPSYI
jgi:hypothetical protein